MTNGSAGVLFLLPKGGELPIKAGSGRVAFNFTSNLYAINRALGAYFSFTATLQLEGFTVYSDSRSAIEEIKHGNAKLSQEIHKLVDQMEEPIQLVG